MTKKEQFHDFCESQIERLGGAFPDFRFMRQGAVQELVAWLEGRAAGDRSRATTFVTSLTEFSAMPTMADMSRLWARMFPSAESIADQSCQYCRGSGWEEIEVTIKTGPFAGEKSTGALRCRCGGIPPTPRAEDSYTARTA